MNALRDVQRSFIDNRDEKIIWTRKYIIQDQKDNA